VTIVLIIRHGCAGLANQPTIDVQGFKANGDKVRTYCIYDGTGSTLMQAVEKVLQTGK
jgi:hypothetical protein